MHMAALEQILMVEIRGVMVMTLLYFVITFGVKNSSSSHPDNRKNYFLVLSKGPTDDINGSVGTAEKKFSINSKAKKKFCLILHQISFVNRKEINKFIANNKNCQLSSSILSRKHLLSRKRLESGEVSFKGNVYDFSVD